MKKGKFLKKAVGILLMINLMCILSSCACKTQELQETEATEENTKSFTYWLIMHPYTAKNFEDLNEHPAAKRLEEQTGAYVDYINPPITEEQKTMNALLASGKVLPDLIRYNFKERYRGGVSIAVKDKVLLDATELIKEYAPNFMKMINSDEDLKRGAYTDDGIIEYFGATIPAKEMRGLPFNGPMINKTYLDQVGLDVPKTIADWEEILEAFKELGVEIPFTFGSSGKFVGLYNAFSGAYGVPAGAKFYNENGTIKFGPSQDGYKDFLSLFHKWYENGWLDPNFMLKNQNKEVTDDFDMGKIGASVLHTNTTTRLPAISSQQGKEMVAVPAPYPVLKEGDKVHFRHFVANFNQTPCFISADAKDPITIIKWVDYLYSPEGIKEISWGTKGDSRYTDTYQEQDGKKELTDFIMKNSDMVVTEEAMRKYLLRDTAMVWDWEMQKFMYKDERQQKGWSVWREQADFDYVLPDEMTMNIREHDEYSKIMGDVERYVNEMSEKFIKGEKSLEDYDEFTDVLEEMNINRAVEIQQKAFDRYMKR